MFLSVVHYSVTYYYLDIKVKLDRLNNLWITIQTAAKNRGKSLEEALVAAEKFWEELTGVMKALKELQGNLNGQEPPAVEPAAVHQQQEVLHVCIPF